MKAHGVIFLLGIDIDGATPGLGGDKIEAGIQEAANHLLVATQRDPGPQTVGQAAESPAIGQARQVHHRVEKDDDRPAPA